MTGVLQKHIPSNGGSFARSYPHSNQHSGWRLKERVASEPEQARTKEVKDGSRQSTRSKFFKLDQLKNMHNFTYKYYRISGSSLLHLFAAYYTTWRQPTGIAYFGLSLHDEDLSGKRNPRYKAARIKSSLIFFMILYFSFLKSCHFWLRFELLDTKGHL